MTTNIYTIQIALQQKQNLSAVQPLFTNYDFKKHTAEHNLQKKLYSKQTGKKFKNLYSATGFHVR